MSLALGMTVKNLRDVAMAFHLNYNDLQGAEFWDALPESDDEPQPHRQAITILLNGLETLLELCGKTEVQDRLYTYISNKLKESRRLMEENPEPLEVCRRITEILPLRPGNVGSQANWSVPPKEVRDRLLEIGLAVRSVALPPILRELQMFALDYARARRETDGRAEFHDLLVWTHELLRDNIEVRDHFRRRFSHLLIDESQDTDPIQAEIAMFLAEAVDADVEPGHQPKDWEKITPEKGKLFVVGDPKQSIYRFRRADVNQMYVLQNRMGGETVELTQNFRSQKPVTTWVNYLFAKWLGEGSEDAEGHIQAAYPPSGMEPRWQADTAHEYGPRVWALADEVNDGNMDSVREMESQDIARLLHHITCSPWQVLDQDSSGDPGETYRPVTYADICILMPRRTGLRQLELALEDEDIPYRLESASLVFETQEIRDLVNCFKAIDDPSDQVATVAACVLPPSDAATLTCSSITKTEGVSTTGPSGLYMAS